MIPILYDENEQSFTSEGLCRLTDATRCIVTEELNGIYNLELDYPISGLNYDEITEGRIIGVIHDDRKDVQPFDIVGRSAPIEGVVTFYAQHISYRLGQLVVKPFTASSITEAMGKLATEAMIQSPFTYWTDKSVASTYQVSSPSAIRSLLGGSSGSILDVYGKGEYEFDKWAVKLYINRGADNGVEIRYGKNLVDLEYKTDISENYNAVAPFWTKDGSTVVLPEGYIVRTGSTGRVKVIPLDLSDSFEDAPTVAELRTLATARLNNSDAWVMDENITVDFIQLWQTEDYKDIAALERVALGDKVAVVHPVLGLAVNRIEVVKVEYDALEERYTSMELGKKKTSFAEAIMEKTKEDVLEIVPSKEIMQDAIDYATEMITGVNGGNVVINRDANGRPYELLIMDKVDKADAVNVWRWNLNGLGHSHSGYSGPFSDIALTADGKINAARIITGILNANVIRAGLIADTHGYNYWNLETGDFSLSAAASIGGSTISQHTASAISTANGYTDTQLADYSDTVDAVVSNLQSQIDGQIMSWYYDYEPTMNNLPASQWTTTALRQQHEGDVFYWKSKGYAYRFMQTNSTWGWTLIQDTDITTAIAKAENAQDTADHKRRVFVTQPVPPYDIGDLWAQGSSGDLYRCETARTSGSYVAGDWKKATKYTDDSAFTAFRDGTYATFVTNTNSGIQSAQDTANSRITTYYQASQPTGTATGDLWIDTDDGNKLYRYNGSSWVSVRDSGIQTAITAAGDAQSTADSKIITFAQASQPTATDVGDLWIDTDDSNKMYRWSGSAWVAYTDISALNAWINGAYASTIQTIQGQIDGKAETFHQATDPSTSWSSGDYSKHTGDLWYDTRDNTTHYWNGTAWVAQDVPDDVFDAIDGKAQIFVNTPVPPYNVGDLWFNSSSSDIMTCTTARATGSYTASDWQKRNKYTDDTAVTTLNTSLNQSEIFNRLTNNGALQGIYMSNGELYINGTYVKAGTLNSLRIVNGSNFTVETDGSVTAKAINITGGSIKISTNTDTYDVIELSYTNSNGYTTKAQYSPLQVRLDGFDADAGMATRTLLAQGGAVFFYRSGNQLAAYGADSASFKYSTGQQANIYGSSAASTYADGIRRGLFTGASLCLYDTSGVARTRLLDTGVTLYDSAGSVKSIYDLQGVRVYDSDGKVRAKYYQNAIYQDASETTIANYGENANFYNSGKLRAQLAYNGLYLRDSDGKQRTSVQPLLIIIKDSAEVERMRLTGTSLYLKNASGVTRFQLQAATAQFFDDNSNELMLLNTDTLRFKTADGTQRVYINAAYGVGVYNASGSQTAGMSPNGFNITNDSTHGVLIDGAGFTNTNGRWEWKAVRATDNTICYVPAYVPN